MFFSEALACILIYLLTFIVQSVPIVFFRRNCVLWLFALSFTLLPFSDMASEVLCNSVPLRDALLNQLVVLLPITVGDIFGWIAGFHIRKLLDNEAKTNESKTVKRQNNDSS